MSRQIHWMNIPEKEVFSIEYYSESEKGKTHDSLTFPNVAICDTLSEGEVWQVAKKLGVQMVFQARTFDDIERFINSCITNPKVESIAIDSGADLREMAEASFQKRTPEQMNVLRTKDELRTRPSLWSQDAGGVQWRWVNNLIDNVINKVKLAKKYLIVTGRLKDEWVKNPDDGKWMRSGERIHDGYGKFEYGYGLSVRIRLTDGIEVDGKRYFTDWVFGKVIKNRFVPKRVQKPYFFDHTYQGLVEKGELFDVWCENFDAGKCDVTKCVVCPKCQPKDVFVEAGKFLKGIGFIDEIPEKSKVEETAEAKSK